MAIELNKEDIQKENENEPIKSELKEEKELEKQEILLAE